MSAVQKLILNLKRCHFTMSENCAGVASSLGLQIEAGANIEDIKNGTNFAGVGAAAAGAAVGGTAAATATGLGGVGVAASGTAIGISAATAVALPAAAGALLGFGAYKLGKRFVNYCRKNELEEIAERFNNLGQVCNAERLWELEAKGQAHPNRRPLTWDSAIAVKNLLLGTVSDPDMHVFASPTGQIILTYDISKDHWAWIMFNGSKKFEDESKDSHGDTFDVGDSKRLDNLIESLVKHGLVEKS